MERIQPRTEQMRFQNPTPRSGDLLAGGSSLLRLILTAAVLSIGLSACAMHKPPPPPPLPPPVTAPPAPRSDQVHTVAPGETLWRIAKTYDVTVDSILRANPELKHPRSLKQGETIVVPAAAVPRPVVPLYPNTKWRYIIIHHSATDEGSSLTFHQWHLRKGWDKGVGYHFVIDNGTEGKPDGFLEATPRWIHQWDGAHCKASDMNRKAIGICLVGNFDNGRPTEKQMATLVSLVRRLQRYYHIPASHILGHGQVEGAATHCPGANFPWREFRRRLRAAP